MENVENEELESTGDLFFDKGILLSIVCAAVKETVGVVDMYQPLAYKIKKNFTENISAGVNIKYTDFGIQIDVSVIVKPDTVVNDIVFRLQQNIKNAINSMIDIPMIAINIHVMDVQN